MQDRIGLDDLRLVRAIGDAATLTGAARALGVDHSTAFRRLGALEARLGVRLFLRARDGYTPTDAGEAAIAAARRLLEELAELEHRLVGEDLRPSGLVRITTTDTLLDVLAPALARFRLANPAITIEVVTSNAFLTLTRRDADVAIRPAIDAPEHLAGRRICGLASAPYASPAYLARRGDARALDEHDWLGPDDTLAHLGSARWMDKYIASERVVLKAGSLVTLRAAAREGLGVAPLPCYLGDADPALRRIGAPIPEMESALWLLTHPDLRRTARIRAFLDFLAPWLAARRALFEGEA